MVKNAASSAHVESVRKGLFLLKRDSERAIYPGPSTLISDVVFQPQVFRFFIGDARRDCKVILGR
jgi:hypothetical protein